MQNKRLISILTFIFILFFISCVMEEEHCVYQIDFNTNTYQSNYNIWKEKKPESYTFIYELGIQASLGPRDWRVKVTVNGNSKKVQFITDLGNTYIPNYSDDSYCVPKENEAEYIDSIDDLFEELLNQYNIHKQSIENKKYWMVRFNVDYNNENHYPEKVFLSIDYEKPPLDNNGNTLIGHGSDYLYYIIIRDFVILD